MLISEITDFIETIGYHWAGHWHSANNNVEQDYTIYIKDYYMGVNSQIIRFQITLIEELEVNTISVKFMCNSFRTNDYNFSIQNVTAIDALKRKIIEAERDTISEYYFDGLLKQI